MSPPPLGPLFLQTRKLASTSKKRDACFFFVSPFSTARVQVVVACPPFPFLPPPPLAFPLARSSIPSWLHRFTLPQPIKCPTRTNPRPPHRDRGRMLTSLQILAAPPARTPTQKRLSPGRPFFHPQRLPGKESALFAGSPPFFFLVFFSLFGCFLSLVVFFVVECLREVFFVCEVFEPHFLKDHFLRISFPPCPPPTPPPPPLHIYPFSSSLQLFFSFPGW